MGQPLPSAQVKDLLEDLFAVSDHQRDEDEKGRGRDEELEGELGIVIVERQEEPDLVADEPRPDAEDDRIDPSELFVVVHDCPTNRRPPSSRARTRNGGSGFLGCCPGDWERGGERAGAKRGRQGWGGCPGTKARAQMVAPSKRERRPPSSQELLVPP